jgi:hypothetical protein
MMGLVWAWIMDEKLQGSGIAGDWFGNENDRGGRVFARAGSLNRHGQTSNKSYKTENQGGFTEKCFHDGRNKPNSGGMCK